MADQPSTLDVLVRADHRWSTRHGDDPTDHAYLQHLANTLDLLRPPPPAADTDARNRIAREAADARDERDTARAELADARERYGEMSAERDRLADKVDDLRAAVVDARVEAVGRRDADQRVLRDVQRDRDWYCDLLAQLVAALTGGTGAAAVAELPTDAAPSLVVDAIASWVTAARTAAAHRHQFAYRGPNRPPGPCDCGTPFPTARRAVTAPTPPHPVGDTAGAPRGAS